MPLPSRRDIQIRLSVLVGVAALTLVVSGLYAEVKTRNLKAASEVIKVGATSVSWDDVNLQSGHTSSPEDDVAMARSGILGDFEAR